VGDIKLIRVVLVVPFVVIVMLLAATVLAQAKPTDIFFVPPQPNLPFPDGVTGTCTDTEDPIDTSTCTILELGGPPEGLICDIPVTFEQAGIPVVTGFQCRTPEGEQTQSQHHPQSQSGSAPILENGEQDGESGEVDQTAEVS
jgi:hypothetical protein